jgi:Leucine-rich repeat (LRR) protein
MNKIFLTAIATLVLLLVSGCSISLIPQKQIGSSNVGMTGGSITADKNQPPLSVVPINILNLSGQGLEKVPSSVFKMTNLEELDLSNNRLTGALPGEIRFLKNLRKLNVSNNQMTGIPAEIGQLTNLEELDYQNNQITGLPMEIQNLKKLRVFNLAGNNYSELDMAGIKRGLPNLQVIGK